jgi:DNA-binding NarL/FixJ family response regulator
MKGLIVDDHQLFVAGIKHVLKQLGDNVEILEAPDAESCLELLAESRDMDFLLLDLQLPGLDGLALLEILRNRWPWIPVLIVTGTQDAQTAQHVLDAGAAGYLCKTSPPAEFVKAIKQVLNGEVYISAEQASFLHLAGESAPSLVTRFTSRQLEVLNLMAHGHPNKIIASKLGLTEHTVKVHISNIFHTMNVHNRTACVKEAVRLGIVHLPVGI